MILIGIICTGLGIFYFLFQYIDDLKQTPEEKSNQLGHLLPHSLMGLIFSIILFIAFIYGWLSGSFN
jgi:TRAP-type C4-dicarboxylate transport system permease large subunit